MLFGLEDADDPARDLFRPGALPALLPAGTYRFANAPHDARLGALAFALGCYQFARYRKPQARDVRLVVPEGVDGEDLSRIVEAVTLARDLINTPSNDMGPAEIEQAARALAGQHGAKLAVTSGDALANGFPLVHAVGAGSERKPRLIDLTWGKDGDPKITLVGKGVAFDTGGLDIKPSSGMLNMKKDMGGAATALALGHMIMAAKLKVRLRIIVPAVENAISGAAFRPRDVYRSRQGISVEIGNTDAEGRLVLADALTLASEDDPALLIDFATLTGAARVAMGPDVAPFFTEDEALAAELMDAGGERVRSGVAAAAVAALRFHARFQGRRRQQCLVRRPGRRHHRRAVPAPLRQGARLAASRHFRLDAVGAARPAGRRRIAVGTRAVCGAEGALFVDQRWIAAPPKLRSFPHPAFAARAFRARREPKQAPAGIQFFFSRHFVAALGPRLRGDERVNAMAHSTPAFIRFAPRSRQAICAARSRPRASSTARATK